MAVNGSSVDAAQTGDGRAGRAYFALAARPVSAAGGGPAGGGPRPGGTDGLGVSERLDGRQAEQRSAIETPERLPTADGNRS